MNQKLLKGFIVTTFVSLYLVVSIISTIHVIDFFKLSNPEWLAISLAIAFEIGATASLASIIAMDKMNKTLVWFLFIILTMMQMMGNTFYAFTHLENYQSWVELFGLVEEEVIYQKRMLSIISGGILPIVALGFIKALVDYIRPAKDETVIEFKEILQPIQETEVIPEPKVSPKKTRKAKRSRIVTKKVKNAKDSKNTNETTNEPEANLEITTEKANWNAIEIITQPLNQPIESEKSQVSEIPEDAGNSKSNTEAEVIDESFNQEPVNDGNSDAFEKPAEQSENAIQESLVNEEINNIESQSETAKTKARMHPQIMPGVLE